MSQSLVVRVLVKELWCDCAWCGVGGCRWGGEWGWGCVSQENWGGKAWVVYNTARVEGCGVVYRMGVVYCRECMFSCYMAAVREGDSGEMVLIDRELCVGIPGV